MQNVRSLLRYLKRIWRSIGGVLRRNALRSTESPLIIYLVDIQTPTMQDAGKRREVSDATQAKFNRGAGIAVKSIEQKSLRERVRYEEKLANRALKESKKVYEWLHSSDAGGIEAEGAEKSRQFKQPDIAEVQQLLPTLRLRSYKCCLGSISSVLQCNCAARDEAPDPL
jgi:excinuclease UvrABC helicase subunit UvrB